MLGTLSSKLQGILRDLKGEGRLSERHVEESMREIRIALLEADVHFKVVKEFVARVKERSLGQEVLRSLTPGQQVLKIVRDELVELLGKDVVALNMGKTPPTVVLLVGLQGSGKTTTTGKLGLWLKQRKHQPLLVSTDVYRPAAIEQLAVVAEQVGVALHTSAESNALGRARSALVQARNMGFDVLLIDTAGRLHIDEELMEELETIRGEVEPDEVLLVADSMTGQDAVNSASQFNSRLGLSGVILSKMDGDARGGAALSISKITGQAVKFIGTGEKYDALEPFYPERMASRILGQGDVLSLIEKAEKVVDTERAEEMLGKLRRDEFTLEDFRDQLQQIRGLGPLEKVLGMLPQVGAFKGLNKMHIEEKGLVHLEAILSSMTNRERANHKIINASRRKRIARGSGRSVSEVNRLLKQYVQTKKMMKKVSKGFFGKQLSKASFPI